MVLRAIFFDMDDTLVATSEHDKSGFKACADLAAAKAPGLDRDSLLASYKKRLTAAPWDPEDKVPLAEWRSRHWSSAFAEVASGSIEPDAPQGESSSMGRELHQEFDRVRLGELSWLPGVPELVQGLKADGYQVCIITNGHSDVQHPKLRAVKASELFEHIIVGGDEVKAGRKEKPDAGIFAKACELTGVRPEEALHIGDSLASDVGGALAAGLAAAVWVRLPGAAPPKPGGPTPHLELASVLELPAALASLRGGDGGAVADPPSDDGEGGAKRTRVS